MKVRLCIFLLVLQTGSWVCETSRPFAPNDATLLPPPGINQSPLSSQVSKTPKQGEKRMVVVGVEGEAELNEEEEEEEGESNTNKIGSSPPSCEHKCYGCEPCEATQVPTTTTSHSHGHSHVGIQYTNYEPEGWKCKCGPTFYSP